MEARDAARTPAKTTPVALAKAGIKLPDMSELKPCTWIVCWEREKQIRISLNRAGLV